MQKFTIFTVIFSFTVMLIMAELVINDYLERNKSAVQDSKTSILSETVVEEDDENTESETNEVKKVQTILITDNNLSSAGLENIKGKTTPFNGKLFQLVELPGLKETDVIKTNFFQDLNYILTSYEIHLNDTAETDELYKYIVTNAQNQPDITVNENNSFGNNSFYINNTKKKKTVFLVVRINTILLAFEYAHKYHPNIKQLISLLAY